MILIFILFMIPYWAVALNHYFVKEIKFFDEDGNPIISKDGHH